MGFTRRRLRAVGLWKTPLLKLFLWRCAVRREHPQVRAAGQNGRKPWRLVKTGIASAGRGRRIYHDRRLSGPGALYEIPDRPLEVPAIWGVSMAY